MTTVLHRKGDLVFCVSDRFESRFLVPHLENMKEKMLTDQWDDYNEVNHFCRLLHDYAKRPGLVLDFHTMRRVSGEEAGEADGEILGTLMVSHGAIDPDIYAASGLRIAEPPAEVGIFHYFHIAPQGRGNGAYWLNAVILPLYAELGYSALYLKSSHPKSFPLYERLGGVMGAYTQPSDNGIHLRTGRIFRLPLKV